MNNKKVNGLAPSWSWPWALPTWPPTQAE